MNSQMKSQSLSEKSLFVPPVSNEKIEHRAEGKNVLNDDTYILISGLEAGKTYEQVFLIAEVTCVRSKDKSYARVTFKDVSSEISGVIWNYRDGSLSINTYVQAKVDVKIYRDNLEFQAVMENVLVVDVPSNRFDYIKGVTDNTLNAYAGEVEDYITSMEDTEYRNVMCDALNRLDLLKSLKKSPYGINGPMSYPGGLLVHVTHAMRFCNVAIHQAKEHELLFCPSLVIAGCALRNIGWYTTTRFQNTFLESRDAYRMIGIQRASAKYIDHLITTSEENLDMTINNAKRHALENMCNESSKILTMEGKMVACADDMADVLDFGAASLQRKQVGNWSNELFTGHVQ